MDYDTDAAWAEQELQERHRREDEMLLHASTLHRKLNESDKDFQAHCRQFNQMMDESFTRRMKRIFK